MSSLAGTPQADPSATTACGRHWRVSVAAITAGLWLLTAVGALLGLAAPGLAAGGAPHPAVEPSLGAVAEILGQNLRVLAAPYLLAVFRFDRTPRARLAGDVLVAAILASNGLHVGLALGRWQARLLPYLPQLPLEYLAAAVAAGAWTDRRNASADHRALWRRAMVTALLLAAAAATDGLATPHAR